jgi:hypothetical protein
LACKTDARYDSRREVAATEVAVPAPVPAAQPAAVAELLALAERDNRVQEHLLYLSKHIGPRLTGTKAYDESAAWARDQFAAFGLDARLETFGEFPVGFERGVSRGRVVAPDERELEFITSAWSAGTAGPVRGRAVLEPKNEAELTALEGRLNGAWVLRSESRSGGDNSSDPDREARAKIRELLESTEIAGFVRAGSESGLLTMGGNHRVDPDKLPTRVQVRLVHDQFQSLVQEIESGVPVELEFDIQNRFTPGPVPCQNVIADWVGREHPDEYVIIQAHLDSWDGAEGAQDNGAGVATTLEAARLIAATNAKPRRTIRFILYGGEEQGLLGSAQYVKAHADSLARTSIVLNHDGGSTHLQGLAPTYAMIDDFERVFAPVKDLDPKRPFRLRELLGLENSGDSDHAPFLAAGVPAFFWEQSEEGYEIVHHTQFDDFETVDPAEQEHSARVVAVAAFGFAELDHLLDRTDMTPLPRRRLGASFDGARVRRVMKGKAQDAGWEVGDVVVSIDGTPVSGDARIGSALQEGGATKTFRLRRENAEFETTIDWNDESAEADRAERAQRRAAFLTAKGRAGAR